MMLDAPLSLEITSLAVSEGAGVDAELSLVNQGQEPLWIEPSGLLLSGEPERDVFTVESNGCPAPYQGAPSAATALPRLRWLRLAPGERRHWRVHLSAGYRVTEGARVRYEGWARAEYLGRERSGLLCSAWVRVPRIPEPQLVATVEDEIPSWLLAAPRL